MTVITFTDRLPTSSVRRTEDGYLVADAAVARTGIQEYMGVELGRPDLDRVRVYRPESSVFAQDVMRSFAHRPVTDNHPNENVTAENWKKFAVGITGGEVMRDGDLVRVPLTLMDSSAIAAYDAGKRELSMGYTAEITFKDGVTPDGQPYDAEMGPARMNHVALVDRARGGEKLKIGDNGSPLPAKVNQNGGLTMADTLKTVLVDGLSVSTTEQGAQAIAKLQDDAQKLQAAIADKDATIARLEAERDDAKGKVLSDADIDARVAARADLIGKAKQLHDADYSGKTDTEIRRMAVAARIGDAAIAGKPDAYVEARFDILAEDSADPVRNTLRDTAQPIHDNGQSVYEAKLQNAWKN